ncbi:hypothetical protein FMEAI12_4570005 [Parafrankia sp. Ea1.12]|nr:hypothetical protein FMEAI12_4570005 [Parafrankia sp. Ea1.12]
MSAADVLDRARPVLIVWAERRRMINLRAASTITSGGNRKPVNSETETGGRAARRCTIRSCRILYVDNDPIVLAHARALLTSTPEGRTAYLDADFRDPETILESDQLRETLDLSQPIAVSLIAIVHFIVDDTVVKDLIDRIMRPLPAGSILALSTCTADSAPEEVRVGVAAYNANGIPLVARGQAGVERFFYGLELLDPGVVLVNHWHPDEQAAAVDDAHVHMYGGIARKP